MNLQELQETKKSKLVKRALREHYDVDLDFSKMNSKSAKSMLVKVRGLLSEARGTRTIHHSHTNDSYLKLVMMEQALSDHLDTLRHEARVIVENEEVQKSQVILAAQDMVDSIQKMLEQVSKMNIEELAAVVDGIQNEFGSSESEQFNGTASEALSTLQQSLTTAKTGLSSALAGVTGQGGATPDQFQPADTGAEPELGMEPEQEPEMEPDQGMGDMEVPEEEPEDLGGAGRGLR